MSEEYNDPKGGEPSYEGDGPNLRYDDFVGRIVQDPNAPPRVTLLSGYLGSSSEEGHVRLYLDEELGRYVEIPEKAIRHTQELPPEQSPLGGSLVWIDRDAEVLHGAAGSERSKATFLEGQIAQDYIGGAGGGITTQTRECGGGVGILPTDMGPGCGQSQYGFCPPPTEALSCRTKTGIVCTRFGPSCRTVFIPACQSVYHLCATQNQAYCMESGFMGCTPVDFTIWQEQFARQAPYAGGGGAEGFAAGPLPTIFCPPPTRTLSCQSRYVAACFTRFPNECVFDTALRCASRVIRCPTVSEPRCRISAVAFCPDTQFGCQADTAFCGFNAAGGGGQGFEAQAFAGAPTQTRECTPTETPECHAGATWHSPRCHGGRGGGGAAQWFGAQAFAGMDTAVKECSPTERPECHEIPTRSPRCYGGGGQAAFAQTVYCPTRYNCPSRYTPCQSQLVRCPSAVDACPTRFGCYETAVCGESVGCFPGGGF